MAAGILAVIYPVFSSVAVIVLLGWLLIISGVLQGISLIGAGHVPHFWLQLISVILAVLIGLLFLRDPGQGLLTITLLLIVFFMIEGISKMVFALTIRPFPNWGWVLASGLVGILLSLILWASLPVTARVADRAAARHRAHQRRRGDRISRLAGAAKLTAATGPACRFSGTALQLPPVGARVAAGCITCKGGTLIWRGARRSAGWFVSLRSGVAQSTIS